jgi:hypothetical protein
MKSLFRPVDNGEHKANNPAWTSRIASPITRLWWFAFAVAFALAKAPIGWRGEWRGEVTAACPG